MRLRLIVCEVETITKWQSSPELGCYASDNIQRVKTVFLSLRVCAPHSRDSKIMFFGVI